MFGFFRKKREVERLKEDMYSSFGSVKKDFNKVGEWIKHFDGKHKIHEKDILDLKKQISDLQMDVNELKELLSFFGPQLSKQLFKQGQTAGDKQTAVEAVQTPVQTAVQTGILSNLTVMERAIVWSLVNSEVKLSYEDLAALLGKDRSTIRGQINALKQKNEGLIEEAVESNGRKRLYVPDKMKDFIIKSVKVRVKAGKRAKK